MGVFVPPGATDTAGIGITEIAKADHVTAYFDSQITWGSTDSTDSTMILPYVLGIEGHCTSPTNCATLADYDFFIANSITGETLLQNTSGAPHQLSVPAVTQFATLGNYVAAGPIISNDAADSNPFSLSKNAIADVAPGATYVSLKAVAGTNMGTCKIVIKAGTSATPVTLIDNVGSGC